MLWLAPRHLGRMPHVYVHEQVDVRHWKLPSAFGRTQWTSERVKIMTEMLTIPMNLTSDSHHVCVHHSEAVNKEGALNMHIWCFHLIRLNSVLFIWFFGWSVDVNVYVNLITCDTKVSVCTFMTNKHLCILLYIDNSWQSKPWTAHAGENV